MRLHKLKYSDLYKNMIIGMAILPISALADEGMWTYDQVPVKKIEAAYGFKADAAFLSQLQNSSIRLSSGCSASFVSKSGLILTNWHCTEGCTSDLSTAENDYSKNGFLAASFKDEKKCEGTSAEVLESITDISKELIGTSAENRTKTIADATKRLCDASSKKYRCDLVNLYRGGQYKIYKYRIYDDVRLVFTPEYTMGFFGGDPDNFNFPRFNLDASFLRAYEDGKPVNVTHHLEWTNETPKQNDLVFVSGNPGSTQRLGTLSQLDFLRDWQLPTRQLTASELRGRLIEHMNDNDDNRRESTKTFFSLENRYKAQYGQMRALMNPDFYKIKKDEETAIRSKLNANPKLKKQIGDPWAKINTAVKAQEALFLENEFLEDRAGSGSALFIQARRIVRAANDKAKPLTQRDFGFTDANIAIAEKLIAANNPIYKNLEQIALESWLSKTREYLTTEDENVKLLLGNESPESLAKLIVENSKLYDPEFRKALYEGGNDAILKSDDPMIKLILRMNEPTKKLRKKYADNVTNPINSAAENIAKARFAIYGDEVYPDATFTLRLSYGKVDGWEYNGKKIPYATTIGGLYGHATGKFPFEISQKWIDAKDSLNKDIVFNFVSTNDIIGGNSGSPVIDKKGRVVGAAFDGNIHSLGGNFAYDGKLNRTVVVTTSAVEEALKKVYKDERLLKELYSK